MAIMRDQKPVDTPGHWGEGEVWEAFNKNLGSDIIVYNHREVKGREFDFCLLMPGIGLAIVEVKGWSKDYIVEVKGVDEIYLSGESEAVGSPKKQARGYKFALLNLLKERYGVTPLILDLVCYPYLSKEEYTDCRLDIISDADTTLFKEDLIDQRKIGNKLINAYNQLKYHVHNEMDNNLIRVIRQHFEPIISINKRGVGEENGYSLLLISNEKLDEKLIGSIIDGYFKGQKTYVFVRYKEDVVQLMNALNQRLQKENIKVDNLNLVFDKQVEYEESTEQDTFRIFNLEIYHLVNQVASRLQVIIRDGNCSEEDRELLKDIAKITTFNYDQYLIEHAPAGQNILVRAGAGTGKTYSMVSRVAYLCNRQGTSSIHLMDAIAMVTFTNEAADNMKKRLKQAFMNYFILTREPKFIRFIEEVDQMQISTIHKFAKNIIKDAAMEVGIGSEFSISSSRYLKEQIYEKYLNEYIVHKKRENSNFYKELKLPIYQLKKILIEISSQLYNKSIDIKLICESALGKSIEIMPFFNQLIAHVVIRAEEEYAKRIVEFNKIDLKECMLLLNQVVSGEYKNKCDMKYEYLFIDEFQDTDDIQIETFLALQEIIGFKLFIVGDLKQSIYRFRGATIEAFSKVNATDNQWRQFELSINYRSDNRLLEQYDQLFTRMRKEGYLPNEKNTLKLTSNIESDLPKDKMIELVRYHSSKEETFYDSLFNTIEEQKVIIQELKKNTKLSKEEQIIAILVRENWQIDYIVKEAKKRNVQIETTVGGDLYKLTPAIDFYKLVLALNNPQEVIYLYNLIVSNNVGIQFNVHALHGASKEQKKAELIRILDLFYSERLGMTWNELIRELHNKPVLMVLKKIYDQTKPWMQYSSDENKQHFYRANYELILEMIIKNYSIDYLTLNRICHSMKINIVTGQEEMARNISMEQNGIRVLCTTVHKAKGLEYGTVLLPYTNQNIESFKKSEVDVVYEQGHLGYAIRIGKNKCVNSYYDINEEIAQRAQEEARVFYVALTRAIRNLIWFRDEDENTGLSWKEFLEGK